MSSSSLSHPSSLICKDDDPENGLDLDLERNISFVRCSCVRKLGLLPTDNLIPPQNRQQDFLDYASTFIRFHFEEKSSYRTAFHTAVDLINKKIHTIPHFLGDGLDFDELSLVILITEDEEEGKPWSSFSFSCLKIEPSIIPESDCEPGITVHDRYPYKIDDIKEILPTLIKHGHYRLAKLLLPVIPLSTTDQFDNCFSRGIALAIKKGHSDLLYLYLTHPKFSIDYIDIASRHNLFIRAAKHLALFPHLLPMMKKGFIPNGSYRKVNALNDYDVTHTALRNFLLVLKRNKQSIHTPYIRRLFDFFMRMKKVICEVDDVDDPVAHQTKQNNDILDEILDSLIWSDDGKNEGFLLELLDDPKFLFKFNLTEKSTVDRNHFLCYFFMAGKYDQYQAVLRFIELDHHNYLNYCMLVKYINDQDFIFEILKSDNLKAKFDPTVDIQKAFDTTVVYARERVLRYLLEDLKLSPNYPRILSPLIRGRRGVRSDATALYHACVLGNVEMTKMLLDFGARVEEPLTFFLPADEPNTVEEFATTVFSSMADGDDDHIVNCDEILNLLIQYKDTNRIPSEYGVGISFEKSSSSSMKRSSFSF